MKLPFFREYYSDQVSYIFKQDQQDLSFVLARYEYILFCRYYFVHHSLLLYFNGCSRLYYIMIHRCLWHTH